MKKYASLIQKSTLIREILAILPHASTVLATYGIHCGSCVFNVSETLGEGLNRHAISNEDAEDLINDLNLLYRELPPRPPNISISKEAALLIKQITTQAESSLLCRIIIDENQQLALEVADVCPDDHLVFFHKDVPDVHIIVSPLLLPYIGGAEISVKEGRLRIDLPQDHCCKSSKPCACTENRGVTDKQKRRSA